jgi:lycopene cyclase domain-containing protein
MEMFGYLGGLLISIGGLLILDYRYKLAFWYDAKRTVRTLAIAMVVFLLWDFTAIHLGIFLKGDSPYMLPFELAPHFPLEEIFFLFLLCFVTLLLYRGFGRWRRISS